MAKKSKVEIEREAALAAYNVDLEPAKPDYGFLQGLYNREKIPERYKKQIPNVLGALTKTTLDGDARKKFIEDRTTLANFYAQALEEEKNFLYLHIPNKEIADNSRFLNFYKRFSEDFFGKANTGELSEAKGYLFNKYQANPGPFNYLEDNKIIPSVPNILNDSKVTDENVVKIIPTYDQVLQRQKNLMLDNDYFDMTELQPAFGLYQSLLPEKEGGEEEGYMHLNTFVDTIDPVKTFIHESTHALDHLHKDKEPGFFSENLVNREMRRKPQNNTKEFFGQIGKIIDEPKLEKIFDGGDARAETIAYAMPQLFNPWAVNQATDPYARKLLKNLVRGTYENYKDYGITDPKNSRMRQELKRKIRQLTKSDDSDPESYGALSDDEETVIRARSRSKSKDSSKQSRKSSNSSSPRRKDS
jgi:hypothetical protein